MVCKDSKLVWILILWLRKLLLQKPRWKKSGRRYWKNSGMEKPAIWGIRKWWNCFRYSILAEGEPGISDWGGVMSMPTKVIILNVPGGVLRPGLKRCGVLSR